MLVRLLYASRAVDDVSQEQLLDILSQSKTNNPESGITGVLCSSGPIFLQCLEGGRMQVNALYNQIAADPRHTEVVVLSYEEISERKFANWSMGLVRYSETATLDPYRVSGTASMALLHELMARASIVGHTGGSQSTTR